MAKKAKPTGDSLGQAMPSITKDKSTEEKVDPMNDYEAQGHMRTLMDAHQIMNDPEKMQKVHALAGAHHKAIRSIKDIADHYNMKFGGKNAGGPGQKSVPLAALNDSDSDGE